MHKERRNNIKKTSNKNTHASEVIKLDYSTKASSQRYKVMFSHNFKKLKFCELQKSTTATLIIQLSTALIFNEVSEFLNSCLLNEKLEQYFLPPHYLTAPTINISSITTHTQLPSTNWKTPNMQTCTPQKWFSHYTCTECA